MKKLLTLTTAMALVAAPAYAHTVQPSSGSQLAVEYNDGDAIITSEQPTTRVKIVPATSHKQNQRLVFDVVVFNDGQEPINFYPDAISASLNGEQIARISEEQLIKEQKNRAGWASFGAAMATGLAAGLAGTDVSTVRYTDSFGNRAKMTYTSRNHFAEAAVLAGGAAVQVGLSQAHEAEKARIADVAARLQTIQPQSIYQFQVEFALPKKAPNKGIGQNAHFNLTIGGEYHAFDLTTIKERKN